MDQYIIKIKEVIIDETQIYIVMAYAQGGSLTQFMRSQTKLMNET